MKHNNKIRAAGYVRKSKVIKDLSGRTRDIVSPDIQKESFYRYAKANNEELIYIEEDINVSGYKISWKKRKGLMRLYELAERKAYEKLYIYRFSRLGRKETAIIIREFEKLNVSIVATDEDIDIGSAAGKFHRNVIMAMDEYFSDDLAQRTRDYYRYWVENAENTGGWTGGQPGFGYMVKNKHYEIHPEDSGGLRLIVKLYIQGYGYKHIANELTAAGFTGKKAKLFPYNKVRYIISNIVEGKYGGNLIKKIKNEKTGIYEKHEIPNILPILVSEEERIMIKYRHESKKKNPKNAKRPGKQYLLSGLAAVFCDDCKHSGTKLRGIHKTSNRNGKKYSYRKYICKVFHEEGAGCREKFSINMEELDNIVIHHIQKHLKSIGFSRQVSEQVRNNLRNWEVMESDEIFNYRKQIEEAEQKIGNLVQAIADGKDEQTTAYLMNEIKKQDDKKNKYKLEITRLQKTLDKNTLLDQTVETILSSLNLIQESFDNMTFQDKRFVIHNLLSQIQVYPGTKRIKLIFRIDPTLIGIFPQEATEIKQYEYATHTLRGKIEIVFEIEFSFEQS